MRSLKTILALVLLGASLLVVATPLPAPGLLRVPRIYNALITSDAKLEPSRASPYSVPAFPVIGAPGVARIDAFPQQYSAHTHATGRKSHKKGGHSHSVDAENPAEILAVGKNDEKITPTAKMYPLTFHARSVGYYPQAQPFVPYSYAGQPFYGGYPGGFSTFSQIAGPGYGVAGGVGPYSPYPYTQGVQQPDFTGQRGEGLGLRAGLDPFSGYSYGQVGEPSEFSAEQTSSMHMTRGRKGMVDVVEDGDGGVEDEEEEEEEDEAEA